MANKVEFFEDGRAEWRWRVIADNGNIIAISGEGYNNRGDCVRSYLSMQEKTP